MKIYKIKINRTGWDYYDSHIIVANNKKEVIKLTKDGCADEGEEIWETALITEVGISNTKETKPFFLLSSFNAG